MCLKLIFHNLMCDVRPRVARGIHSSPIVNPYADPKPCGGDCPGKKHNPPSLRCIKHNCCMTSAQYVATGCSTKCTPEETTLYHVYSQRQGATPVPAERQWEVLPTIDSYIPTCRTICNETTAFRAWRAQVLSKGGQIQDVLGIMELAETRLAEELYHKHNQHRVCVRNWERSSPDDGSTPCKNQQRIDKWMEKLGKLRDLLNQLEGEYVALQTPPTGVVDATGLITSLSPPAQNRRFINKIFCANADEQWSMEDLKDTVHQLAMFRF